MDTPGSFDEKEFRRLVRRKTMKSFFLFFIFIGLLYAGYSWLIAQPKDDKALRPFRNVLNANGSVFARSFSSDNKAPEYSKKAATPRVRVNGDAGMTSELDQAKWKLKLVRNSGSSLILSDTILISLDELKAMPKTEVVFNFKCIEGWSQVTWWGGVRFSDFAKKYRAGTKSGAAPDEKNKQEDIYRYAGLETPDKEYYVGIDMPSMFQSQTILCYEMNGKPLPENQGAPLRLIIPVKYGIKHLKRIGTIFFSDDAPPDYWAKRGYDYFAGL